MLKDSAESRSLTLGTKGVAVLIFLLVGMRLSELIPITRSSSSGASTQNWRVELYISVFLVICCVWIYRNRVAAVAKLLPYDKQIAATLWCLVGFTLWGAISAIWAVSGAAVALHTVTWLSYLAVLVFSLVLFRTRNGLSAMVTACPIISSITAVICFVDYFYIPDLGRAIGTFRIKYARFAECFLTISPLLCVWALYVRGRVAVLASLAGWLLSWLVVMLSLSKGSFIAGIIGHIILFFGCILLSKYGIRRKMAVFAGVWLGVTLAVQVAFSVFSQVPTTTEYISGEADQSRSTTLMRVFTWQVGWQMVANNPIGGVGANNFGIAFNNARADYHKKRPTDTTAEMAEDYLPERAHNEFLQILAELGVIGAVFFAGIFAFFGMFLIHGFRSSRYKLSPLLWASLAGMAAFFASSFVSSFSFRIAQNGVFFFIIFALAINEVVKIRKTGSTADKNWIRLLLAVCILGAVGMMILLGTRAYADYQINEASITYPLPRALPHYSSAIGWDPDNINAYFHLGVRYANEKQNVPAAAALRKMVDRGGGTTLAYSTLAKYWTDVGDYAAADQTLAEAVAVYPNSVFMRVRYATYLEERRRQAEADEQMEFARKIDAKQANGWYSFIKGDGKSEREIEEGEPEITKPEELLPRNAVTYYLSDRERQRSRRPPRE